MTAKYFDVNEEGRSISCKLYCNDPRSAREAVLFCHGFGGHKDNRAAEKFAGKLLSKRKDAAVVIFNWPCHGDDARKNLLLSDCDLYLQLMISFLKDRYSPEKLYCCATSFGGYLVLKYLAEHGNPFDRIAFRSPAIRMYDTFRHTIITPEDQEKLAKGKSVLAGFDRKVKITQEFLDDIRAADVTKNEYLDWAEDMLILHGTKDEVVPFHDSEEFAENQLVELIPVENADHRYTDPKTMDFAIHNMLEFLH